MHWASQSGKYTLVSYVVNSTCLWLFLLSFSFSQVKAQNYPDILVTAGLNGKCKESPRSSSQFWNYMIEKGKVFGNGLECFSDVHFLYRAFELWMELAPLRRVRQWCYMKCWTSKAECIYNMSCVKIWGSAYLHSEYHRNAARMDMWSYQITQ